MVIISPENCFVKECMKETRKRKIEVEEDEVREKCLERWRRMNKEEQRWFKVLCQKEEEDEKKRLENEKMKLVYCRP